MVQTRLGELCLRRRLEPITATQVYEVKLGEEFLMSSLFTVAEEALADLGLAALAARRSETLSSETRGTEPASPGWSVIVGGLGLGYTGIAALRDNRVGALTVVEALEPVIEWHRRSLLPVSETLMGDPRTSVVLADFFATVAAGPSDSGPLDTAYDAVLLDIDHAPDFVLHESHQGFYSREGLQRMKQFVAPGGVFALWSDNAPDESFTEHLASVFTDVEAHVVSFANPLIEGTSSNTVYVGLA